MTSISIFAHNPGPMTGSGNHTYLLNATSGRATLIDAGIGAIEHLDAIERHLAGATLAQVLVTHGHDDHVSGAAALAKRYPQATFRKHPWDRHDSLHPVGWQPLRDGDRISIGGGEEIVAIGTPGHSPDHLAFWHEASRTVFSGDLVTQGTSVMIHASAGGDLGLYLDSLRRILALEARRLLPAHGPVVDNPGALLTAYLVHRLDRERQVLDALAAGFDTVESIAQSVYDGLDPALMPAARETVRAHLVKLQQERRVVERGSRWII
ncbi:MAG TPA: MBL fold metallo-hydrolase [Vicinamibacterales bacterium]|nr:MBL fold metallo-hydrolase [Vicinamibacterales bacterium]